LKLLLIIHALITGLAGIVLIVGPGLIPGTVGITLAQGQNLLSYLLGAAEIGIAVLSFGAAYLSDVRAIRLVAVTMIVFHLCTAAIEGYAFTQGLDAMIWANVVLRVIVSLLFGYFGLYKIKKAG